MPRLFDADEVLEQIQWLEIMFHDVLETILTQPTVDAVEVVRCKDCRFYIQSNEKCELVDTRLRFYETDKTWTEDCFCAWAERREDANSN